jgi:Uma2 family endonuclease
MAQPAYPLDLPEEQDGDRWPAQGEWTYEDYARLPDDGRRYEVIRGYLYVSPAPTYEHQYAVGHLYRLLANFIVENELGVLLPAPFDVKLPDRIADPVEPDLVFIRAENQPRSGDANFAGVPDLAIEVLSPSTRHIDRGVKKEAYREAGVPEYWLVDPRTRTIEVYRLSEGGDRYVERDRGGMGQTVGSVCLAGLRVPVEKVFPPK